MTRSPSFKPSRRGALAGLASFLSPTAVMSGIGLSVASCHPSTAAAAVGLFTDLHRRAAPRGVTTVQTTGHSRPGVGAGRYRLIQDRGQPETRFRTRMADGRLFELVPAASGHVTGHQLGAIGDGRTDDEPALSAGLAFYRRVLLTRPKVAYLVRKGLKVPTGGVLEGTADKPRILGGANRPPHEPVVGNATIRPLTLADRDRDQVYRNLLIDGNKAANRSQIEWGHGLYLRAVDGALIQNVTAINCQGDGLCLNSGYSPQLGGTNQTHCSRIRGDFRSEGAQRQGTAIIAARDVVMTISSYRSRLYGLDLEPDNGDHLVEDVTIDFRSLEDGDGSGGAGGLAISGAGNRYARNIVIKVQVRSPKGDGVVVRQTTGFKITGAVSDASRYIFFASDGGLPSRGVFDIAATGGSAGTALRINDGGVYQGRLSLRGRVRGASTAFEIRDASGGDIEIDAPDGGAGQGVVLGNARGLRLRGVIRGFASYGLWLRDRSRDNVFEDLDLAGNNTAGFVATIGEDAGSDNNSFRRVNLKPTDKVRLSGGRSRLER